MKLGWGVMHDNSSLWTGVLRGKYLKTDGSLPFPQANGRDSTLWKALFKTWPMMMDAVESRVEMRVIRSSTSYSASNGGGGGNNSGVYAVL
jgi:hypothetical protein